MTFAAVMALLLAPSMAPAQQATPDLTGLWAAKVRFGPDVRGPLLLIRQGNAWRADIAGFSQPVRRSARELSFELPDGRGSFRGKLAAAEIAGHWIGPVSRSSGMRYATPMVLRPDGPGRWRGAVAPLDDGFTFYLPLTRLAGGGYATYLRNPERNQGRFIRATRLEVKDTLVTLAGGDQGRWPRGATTVASSGYRSTAPASTLSAPTARPGARSIPAARPRSATTTLRRSGSTTVGRSPPSMRWGSPVPASRSSFRC